MSTSASRTRHTGARRAALLFVLALLLAGLALLGIRGVGESQRAAVEASFVEEVAPLPEAQAQTLEELTALSDRQVQESIARLQVVREAKEAALRAIEEGRPRDATGLVGGMVTERDRLLAEPFLMGQMVGVASGRDVVEVVERLAVSDRTTQELADADLRRLAAWFEPPDDAPWRSALAAEAVRGLADLRVPEADVLARAILLLQQPYLEAQNLRFYLAMHQATDPDISDVDAHIRDAFRPALFSAWIAPSAAILVPNLVDIVEKRRTYLGELEGLRGRLVPPNTDARAAPDRALARAGPS